MNYLRQKLLIILGLSLFAPIALAERLGGLTDTSSKIGLVQNQLLDWSSILSVGLSFIGILFLVLTLYAGFTWMTAMGNDAKIKTAKKILVAATIGLILVAAAYTITAFIGDSFAATE